ncbi:MAG: hypothetical protein B6I36_07240 [Desulfobacteraceae bacterium 4572_35.1]|nr:MAG: hypothetical protein B6I36_07240 [Desulfobacteraceae bacterium 4572_35.1]
MTDIIILYVILYICVSQSGQPAPLSVRRSKKTPTKSIDIKRDLGAILSFENLQIILWPPNQIGLSATYFGQF